MKHYFLLSIPILLSIAACSKPIELTAANREDAFSKCLAEVEQALDKVEAERQLAVEKPHLFDSSRDDYYDNFEWSFLITDEYEKISILRGYCKPRQLKRKGYWSNTGYIEYLVRPLQGNSESEVKQVIASYGFNWREED